MTTTDWLHIAPALLSLLGALTALQFTCLTAAWTHHTQAICTDDHEKKAKHQRKARNARRAATPLLLVMRKERAELLRWEQKAEITERP